VTVTNWVHKYFDAYLNIIFWICELCLCVCQYLYDGFLLDQGGLLLDSNKRKTTEGNQSKRCTRESVELDFEETFS